MLRSACLIFALASAACASAAEGSLQVPLGLSRAQVPAELKRYEFCASDPGTKTEQTFPRCHRPGIDYRDAWVVASFDGGALSRLARFERWDDDSRAVERWNQLIAARTKLSGLASDDAKQAILTLHELPGGTRSWMAFRADAHTLVAIYLLTPHAPDNASILEELIAAP